jgi:hypothetical protein
LEHVVLLEVGAWVWVREGVHLSVRLIVDNKNTDKNRVQTCKKAVEERVQKKPCAYINEGGKRIHMSHPISMPMPIPNPSCITNHMPTLGFPPPKSGDRN